MISIATYNQSDIFLPPDDNYDDENEAYTPYTRIFENHEYTIEEEDEIDKLQPYEDISEQHNEIFESKEQMYDSIRKIFLGDLYVIGRIWIEALKTVLVGAHLRLVPVVDAAPPPPPCRPPKMGYKDLPIYSCPHFEYKTHEEKKQVCPEYKTKLLHNYLLPHVKYYRKQFQDQLFNISCDAQCALEDLNDNIYCTKYAIKKFMRSPENLAIRQGIVGGGTALGFLMGSNLPKRFILAGLGGLSTGALCFPEETDEFFKNFMARTSEAIVTIYNAYCKKNFSFRQRIPCTKDVPPEPPVKKSPCPVKKK